MVNVRRALRLILGAGLVAFCVGFGWFVRDAERPSAWPARADGIVALTGGALRIDTALMLLRAGVADRLLISGAGPGVTLPDLLQKAAGSGPGSLAIASIPVRASADPGTITLGHVAQTTEGNAVETSWWVHANGVHSLVVVTAGYHMRRALAEIRTVIPQVRLTPYAVQPPVGTRVLLVEYVKLIVTELGAAPLTQSPETT